MTIAQQTQIFGSSFEKLGQDRRVKVLRGYSLLGSEQEQYFEDIRLARKKYLHLWSQDHDSLPADAVKSYRAAAELVLFVLGQDFKDGGFVLKPGIARYLERTGMYTPDEDA